LNTEKTIIDTNDADSNEDILEERLLNGKPSESTSDTDKKVVMDNKLQRKWINFKEKTKQFFIDLWWGIKHPKKALSWLISNKHFTIILIAIISGVVGAGAAWVFSNLISITRIFFFGLMYDKVPDNIQWLLIILVPTLAAAVTAPFLIKWAKEAMGHGIPEVMESIVYKDGFIKTSTPYLKLLLSGVCIGGGLSLGREGPIAQIGAGFSSFLGRKFGLRGRSIKIVVVSGLVAGISATFNAPIGGALFGIEVLLISLTADQLIPVIIASLIATIIGRLILETGASPLFEVPSWLSELNFNQYIPYLHWFLLLGVFSGLVALLYNKAIYSIEMLSHRIKIPPVSIPIIGAFITGIVGVISPRTASEDLIFGIKDNPWIIIPDVTNLPRVFGSGYNTITDLLANNPPDQSWSFIGSSIIFTLILLTLMKILATAFSVGSGNSGGIFAPALFIGATTGYTFAAVINNIMPGLTLEKEIFSLFTLAGLASVFAGSSKAVLTMIFMGAELTSSYQTFLPLMITCSISYFISRIATKDTIYTQKLAARGLNINLAGPTDLLETYRVKDIMTTDVICVPEHMTMKEFSTLNTTMDHLGYPIINLKGEFLGMITTTHLKFATNAKEMNKTVMEVGEKNPYVLYPEETVDHAMRILYRSEIGRIAVLDSPETKNIMGIISNTDILRCLEMQRLKDIEERRFADRKLHEAELRMVENLLDEYPELQEKVRVISRERKEQITQKDLLAYLREECVEDSLSDILEKQYQKHIKQSKTIRRKSTRKKTKDTSNKNKQVEEKKEDNSSDK